MKIEIVPYTEKWEPAVQAFNQRLEKAPPPNRFPPCHEPSWLPVRDGSRIYQTFFVAVEDGATVRGAFGLKTQDFWVDGQTYAITDIKLPLSEGIVEPQNRTVGVQLIFDTARKLPLLIGIGMGGTETSLPRLYKSFGWTIMLIPFLFRVVRSARFLRNIKRLRTTRTRRIGCDLLAVSGLGWLGFKLLQARSSLKRGSVEKCVTEQVDRFGAWTDEVWESAHKAHRFTAVRDRATMSALFENENFPGLKVLKMSRNGRTIGWAVVRVSQMTDNKYFGNMRLGTLVDGFAAPANVPSVIDGATSFLEDQGVDLIVTNQSHQAWVDGLKGAGYLSGPSNYALALSKQLAALVAPAEARLPEFHFNRADGDGPIHL